jgi:hypothetical protein
MGMKMLRGYIVIIVRLRIYMHMVIDVTVTSARTSSNDPAVDAPRPLPGTLATRAQHAKLDADLRNASCLGSPSI